MASHLSTQQVDLIVRLLDSWPTATRLSWDALRQCLRRHLPAVPTRQALARHDRIKAAFHARKAGLRTENPTTTPDPLLAERVRRLTAENARLRIENQVLRERFVRWEYNAYKRGLMPHHLNEPCPEVHRRRSD